MSVVSDFQGSRGLDLEKVIEKLYHRQQVLEKAILSSRVRKAIDYNRNYREGIRSYFEQGDLIAVEPFNLFGIYQVKSELMPEVIPPQKIHLTSSFSQSLGALAANPGSLSTQLTSLDLQLGEIGFYKIVPEDAGYKIEINQPTQVVRFSSKTGSWSIRGADFVGIVDNPDFQSLVPEVFVVEDRTPLTVKAISTNPNSDSSGATSLNNYWVRVKVYGYKFPVVKLDDPTIQRNDPRIVASVWVGNPLK